MERIKASRTLRCNVYWQVKSTWVTLHMAKLVPNVVKCNLVPEEEWIKVMGTHEKLNTLEEHEAIMERLLKNRMLNPNSRRSIFPFSGLLYCEKCGYRMRFQVGQNKECIVLSPVERWQQM